MDWFKAGARVGAGKHGAALYPPLGDPQAQRCWFGGCGAAWDYRHQPAPTARDLSHCPCGDTQLCTGSRGGRFCVTPSGTKRYAARATP